MTEELVCPGYHRNQENRYGSYSLWWQGMAYNDINTPVHMKRMGKHKQLFGGCVVSKKEKKNKASSS